MSKNSKRKPNKPKPLFKWRGSATPGGVGFNTIKCADGKYHPYLNADISDEQAPTAPKQGFCGRCGLRCLSGLIDYAAYSEMHAGNDSALCAECRWDDVAVKAEELANESGMQFMPTCPRHVQLGTPKYHDWPNN